MYAGICFTNAYDLVLNWFRDIKTNKKKLLLPVTVVNVVNVTRQH